MTYQKFYGLASSRDLIVRYFGETCRSVSARFEEHIKNAFNDYDQTPKAKWIREEVEAGYIILPITMFEATEEITEKQILDIYAKSGHELHNVADYTKRGRLPLPNKGRGKKKLPPLDLEKVVAMYDNEKFGSYRKVAIALDTTIERVRTAVIRARSLGIR